MKTFNVPLTYRSSLIKAVKDKRKLLDKLKKDFTPTLLDFGPVQIYLARHFGFCYGVENAIEIAFKTLDENPGKRIFLLSEMIHNPQVNTDLKDRGVQFLQDTSGKTLIPFEEINAEDIVLIPAFGTTLEMENRLQRLGIRTENYDTTCPFVEKVWNRSEQIAKKSYTVIIHGKANHEETRATFSHSAVNTPTVVVEDMEETVKLASYITGERPLAEFYTTFKGRLSEGFDVSKDLNKIGVVNQTTMLATDTQAIADFLRQIMLEKFQLNEDSISDHFADTRDTLCYATNDNQSAVHGLLETPANLAIVVGGYNSSNTSHLVELCEEKLPTFYIDSDKKLLSVKEVLHYNFHTKQELHTVNYLPDVPVVKILITSGASCPDSVVEDVISRLLSFYNPETSIDEMTKRFR